MDLMTVVGTAAAVCSTTSFAPQAWRVLRTRDTAAISKRMYVITVVGFALWTAYGVMGGQWPLIVPNVICLALSAFILAMKLIPPAKVHAIADAVLPADGGSRREDA